MKFTVSHPVPPGVQFTADAVRGMVGKPFVIDSANGPVATGVITDAVQDEAQTTIAITVDLGDTIIAATVGDVSIH